MLFKTGSKAVTVPEGLIETVRPLSPSQATKLPEASKPRPFAPPEFVRKTES